jgi:hypothetical protein
MHAQDYHDLADDQQEAIPQRTPLQSEAISMTVLLFQNDDVDRCALWEFMCRYVKDIEPERQPYGYDFMLPKYSVRAPWENMPIGTKGLDGLILQDGNYRLDILRDRTLLWSIYFTASDVQVWAWRQNEATANALLGERLHFAFPVKDRR